MFELRNATYVFPALLAAEYVLLIDSKANLEVQYEGAQSTQEQRPPSSGTGLMRLFVPTTMCCLQ